MKKTMKLLLIAIMLVLGANSASAVTKKTASPKTAKAAVATTKMTKEEFFKKWGDQYDKFRTCDVYIGLSKQFFLDMQAALPNHFRMQYDTKDAGVTYYVALHFFGDAEEPNIFMFSLGFDKNGLYFFDYQIANNDEASQANLCRQTNWKRNLDAFDDEEDAYEKAMEIEF